MLLHSFSIVCRCSECDWPMCNKKCSEGNTHKIECHLLKAAEKVEFSNFTEPHDKYRAIAPLRLLKVRKVNLRAQSKLSLRAQSTYSTS